MGDFWSSRTFFSSNLMGRIFFCLFFSISFLLHLCCMQFFSSDKRLHSVNFIRLLRVVITPSVTTLLRGENDSKQSDEFQAIFNRDFMESTLFHVVGHRKT